MGLGHTLFLTQEIFTQHLSVSVGSDKSPKQSQQVWGCICDLNFSFKTATPKPGHSFATY